MAESSQKQRQQLTLRQRSYLAVRGVILEQPLGEFESLIDRFVSESVVAEKHMRRPPRVTRGMAIWILCPLRWSPMPLTISWANSLSGA